MDRPYNVVWNIRPEKQLKALYWYIVVEKKEPLSALKLYTEILEFSKTLELFPASNEVYKAIGKATYRSKTYKGSDRLVYRIDETHKRVVITDLFHNSRSPDR